MRMLGIDFGTCNIKGAERKRNGDIATLKLGKQIDKPRVPNIALYEKREGQEASIILGKLALTKSAREQDRIRNIKAHLQEHDWVRTLSFGVSVSAYDVTRDIMKNLYDEIHHSNKEEDISAVITVPVNFSKRQHQIVKKAAEEAGFLVSGVITEPFASFFSLMQDELEENHNVMIFDFGGGTLDLCLIEVRKMDGKIKIQTQATVGISYGGNHINEDILKEILYKRKPEKMREVLDQQEDKYHRMLNRHYIMTAIDEVKETLFGSDEEETDIHIAFRDSIEDFGKITQADIYQIFEKQNWGKRLYKLLDNLFFNSDDMTADEVTDIFMVGGSSAIPYFRNIIESYFIKSGNKDADTLFELNDDMEEEERLYASVARGAAIYNELITSHDENVIIKDKIPFMVYTKGEEERKLTPLMKSDSYKDYRSRLDSLSEAMKREGKIQVYQTIFGEQEKEVYLGDICLTEEAAAQGSLYRLMVDKDRNILAEIGYLDIDEDYEEGEDRFCVDWRIPLEMDFV